VRLLAFLMAGVGALLLHASVAGALTLPPGFDDQPVANYGYPTGFAFVPDGRIVAIGQTGKVRIYKDGALNPTPAIDMGVTGLDRICSNYERGLLGVAVDPGFHDNHFVYLYYTYRNGSDCPSYPDTGPVNRLSRFVLGDDDLIDPATEFVLLDNIPSPYGVHNAGDVHFGNDGYLYVSVGDGGCDGTGATACGGANEAAQFKHVLSGKVLRIESDGSIPPGNPFLGPNTTRCNATGQTAPGQTCQEIWALGFRNPFRFTMDPNASGTQLVINDVGQDKWEEIDRGVAGANYGWPVREGPCAFDSYTDCGPQPAGMTNPWYWYDHSSGCTAITDGAFVPSGLWPSQYDGRYIFADLVCGKLFQLTDDGSGGLTSTEFGSGPGNMIDLGFGPYGNTQALYYTVWGDTSGLRRITYSGASNRNPTAAIDAGPTDGALPLTVDFDASQSSDADNDPLTFDWDFGDGSPHAAGAQASHTYMTVGTYTAKVTVTDGRGGSATATQRIDAGNEAPVPTMDSPFHNQRFAVGEDITLSGSAYDTEDGDLPESALTWQVIKHHATHTHPFFPPTTGNYLTIRGPAPEDFSATTNSYLEVRLTATDSKGLTSTISRDLRPKLVNLDFSTEPPGLQLLANGITLGPQETSWEGWDLHVSAPNQFDTDGEGQTFVSWSDGGAQSHVITTPSTETSYSATFTRYYARPRGSTPLRAALVPSYQPCTAPDRTHGAPLAFGACSQPRLASSRLTVGSPDANGQTARSIGYLRMIVQPGDPATPADEADVRLLASLSDVYVQDPAPTDYLGELQASVPIQITDRQNGSSGADAATVSSFPLTMTMPCSATATAGGSTCSVSTTADALTPGAVVEGMRSIWEAGQVQVFDGGSDGLASTAPNTLFATQGLFVP
jgi:glucose/arabinose dehydrogenase/PKD repeat protein